MDMSFFSTDWSSEPIVDEIKSARLGKQVYVEGQTKLSFGGTFMTRGAMPAMELNKHGYDNHLSYRFEIAPDGHIRTLDVDGEWRSPSCFWSQRWMMRGADEVMRRARSTGQLIIADLDDGFHVLPKTNIASATTDSTANPEFNREHYWKMLAACDAVTVSTEPLKREMERIGVPAFVVRNAVDLTLWPQNDPTADGMIGWIGGIAWRAHDIDILRPSLPQFLLDHNLPVFHGGDSQDPSVPKFWEKAGIDPQRTKCVTAPLTHIAQYQQLWAPLNVSLVPLEKHAFNQCKSWLKSLESCAAGLPYIVSHGFGEQNLLIEEGTAGRVAKNEKPKQWYDHLTALLDPDVRREEGIVNRSIAEKHDIKDCWVDWHNAYEQIRSL